MVKIIEVVRPDIISEIHRKLAYLEASKNGHVVNIPIEQIRSGPFYSGFKKDCGHLSLN